MSSVLLKLFFFILPILLIGTAFTITLYGSPASFFSSMKTKLLSKRKSVHFILEEFDYLEEKKKRLGEGYISEEIDILMELGSTDPKLFTKWRNYSKEIELEHSDDAIFLPNKMLVVGEYNKMIYMDDCYSLEEFKQHYEEIMSFRNS